MHRDRDTHPTRFPPRRTPHTKGIAVTDEEVERVAVLIHAGFCVHLGQTNPERARKLCPFSELSDEQKAGHRAAARAVLAGLSDDVQPVIVESR